MPNFEVLHSLICEDLRPELMGKVSLMGFYGVMPNVKIFVRELDEGVERLQMILAVRGKTGIYPAQFRLLQPSGESLSLDTTSTDISLRITEGKILMLGVILDEIPFPAAGDYRFELLFGGSIVYKSTFTIVTEDRPLSPSRSRYS